MSYLAGDIGGTKTHLALYDKNFKRLSEKKYRSQEYKNLRDILKVFLEEFPEEVEASCFGIAGPIKEGKCEATNLPWIIESKVLEKELEIGQVTLLNDLEANAYGLKRLKESDFCVLNKGGGEGHQALISAGTGLGEAGLFFDGDDHHPFPCEGGHCDFAPRNEREIALLQFLQRNFGPHASFERVLSGPGLYNIYRYLVEVEKKERDPEVEGAGEKEAPKVITKQKSATTRDALDIFVAIYGAEAGNLALKFLALGGLFIGGGIAPKILENLKSEIFMKNFLAKGRLEKVLRGISVKVVLNEETALLGAAHVAVKKK